MQWIAASTTQHQRLLALSSRSRQAQRLLARCSSSPYSNETKRLAKVIATRQAIKTALHFFGETNGELHYFLHTYLAEHPFDTSSGADADEWLVQLASEPWQTVQDPRRSSTPSVASQAAVTRGEREVSPRDVAERIMALRAEIGREMAADLGRLELDNEGVLRRALQCNYKEVEQ